MESPGTQYPQHYPTRSELTVSSYRSTLLSSAPPTEQSGRSRHIRGTVRKTWAGRRFWLQTTQLEETKRSWKRLGRKQAGGTNCLASMGASLFFSLFRVTPGFEKIKPLIQLARYVVDRRYQLGKNATNGRISYPAFQHHRYTQKSSAYRS